MASEQPGQRMTSPKKPATADTTTFEEVNVLVAAFNVFDGFVDQTPSWEIAILLPPTLTVNAAHPSRIRIVVNPVPINCSYEAIDDFISDTFLDGGQCKYQLVLYLAVIPQGRGYWLERRARRDGFVKADVHNKMPSKQSMDAMKSSPPMLETPSRIQDVFKRWQGQLPREDLHVSDDAGLFICEYLFYRSLCHLNSQSNKTLQWQNRTTIACLHVPSVKDAEELNEARDVVTALIYALIDSRRQRNGDFDEEERGGDRTTSNVLD